jgi:hypothetical protein
VGFDPSDPRAMHGFVTLHMIVLLVKLWSVVDTIVEVYSDRQASFLAFVGRLCNIATYALWQGLYYTAFKLPLASLNSLGCLDQPLLGARTVVCRCVYRKPRCFHIVNCSARCNWWTPWRLVVSQQAVATFACLRYPALLLVCLRCE